MKMPRRWSGTQSQMSEFVWHVDGHHILLNIDRDHLQVTAGPCPFGQSEDADCYHAGVGGCVVAYFVNNYGLDTNGGVAAPTPLMEIAWHSEGNPWEPELVNFTMMLVVDTQFDNWYSSAKGD